MGTPVSLLLVEDTASDSELFKIISLREKVGFGVTVVETVEQALEELSSGRLFDVVLSDLHLPGLDGIELLLAMKKDPTLRLIPVLIATNSSHPSEIARAYAAGAAACLTKPSDLDELTRFIRAIDVLWFKLATYAVR